MKKLCWAFFMVASFVITNSASAVNIPYDAWVQVREVHAIYVNNNGGNWEDGSHSASETDSFMEQELLPFITDILNQRNSQKKRIKNHTGRI